jgi:sugar/nucleoside kinase (ribokinase family)
MLSAEHVEEELVQRAEWLFIEGYLFAGGTQVLGAVERAVNLARAARTRIAVTLSDVFIVNGFREHVERFLNDYDLVFANEHEATAFTGESDTERAFDKLTQRIPNVLVTAGERGAWYCYGGERGHVETFPCLPRDLTGAGDMFAGSFLYGVTHGVAPKLAARAACYMAVQVITQVGPRLHGDIKAHWEQAIKCSKV